MLGRDNFRTAGIAIFLLDLDQLVFHDFFAELGVAQYVVQVGYLPFQFLILSVQLVYTQAGKLR